ncbi:hypothetical protein K474DRAFT_714653 [Panus rudis PR-1116 ss-1]|nr:hypothetical protein K474DRAFT_714653 [Panus rudis PR-1116 ss-1]
MIQETDYLCSFPLLTLALFLLPSFPLFILALSPFHTPCPLFFLSYLCCTAQYDSAFWKRCRVRRGTGRDAYMKELKKKHKRAQGMRATFSTRIACLRWPESPSEPCTLVRSLYCNDIPSPLPLSLHSQCIIFVFCATRVTRRRRISIHD